MKMWQLVWYLLWSAETNPLMDEAEVKSSIAQHIYKGNIQLGGVYDNQRIRNEAPTQ